MNRCHGRSGGRGRYSTSSVRRRRTDGRGKKLNALKSALKGIGKFAAKTAPQILKGARFLASKTNNKTLKSIARWNILDMGANAVSNKFGGRGGVCGGNRALKNQAKLIVRKLINQYGVEGTRKILRSYVRSRGRGAVGGVLITVLSSILPFLKKIIYSYIKKKRKKVFSFLFL